MENTYKEIIWKIKIPIKKVIFVWLINQKAILTWENLHTKKVWKGPGRCALCTQSEGTVEHIL